MQRILANSIPEPNSGCWLWEKATTTAGYGEFHDRGKTVYAHRHAYECANGPIPPGKLILHRCDVRSCVNPGHLFLGTYDDNQADMARKGRAVKKLTNAQVFAIREDGRTAPEIAKAYGVSNSSIYGIRSGATRQHVGGERRLGCVRLSEQDIAAIRADPRGCTRIARDYGIQHQRVLRLKRSI